MSGAIGTFALTVFLIGFGIGCFVGFRVADISRPWRR
jgi:hypothetical protein